MERDYFSDDSSDDYNFYYAQVADDAMMGDRDAMDEMHGEFGEGERKRMERKIDYQPTKVLEIMSL